jgi:hypothetical protein
MLQADVCLTCAFFAKWVFYLTCWRRLLAKAAKQPTFTRLLAVSQMVRMFRVSKHLFSINRILAAGLQILEERMPQNNLDYRVQAANRFVLKQMSSDSTRIYPDDTRLDQVTASSPLFSLLSKKSHQVLVTNAMSTLRCLHCYSETMRTSPTYLTDLNYPNFVGLPFSDLNGD